MEKKIHKSYKYRIYPTKEQETFLLKHFGSVRFVYNYFLAQRIQQYQQIGKSDNYYTQAKYLTELKKQEEYSWLKEINSQTLQSALSNLETAYVNFFSGRNKFPRFKKKTHKNSFCVPQSVKMENRKVIIPKLKKLGGIKLVEHRPLQGKILFATFSKTPTNKYFVSITVEQDYNSKQPTKKEIGIDLGIKDLIITSNGNKFKNHKFISKYSKKLKRAQQHLSRKQKGSNRYEKQRLKVALIHEKIHNCRLDNLHKISHKLIMENDVVYMENLNVKGMLRNHKLARSISDCSWSELKRQLHYKGVWDDTYIHEIFRFYPSSKACSNCGHIMDKIPLDVRQWTCPNCKTHHDRDINAAINILQEGKRELSAGTADYTNGQKVRPNEIISNKAHLNEVGSYEPLGSW